MKTYTPQEIIKPNVHSKKSNCCNGVVHTASVSNGWHVEQCQKCYNRCGVK